jgi:hypothetical protein
MPRSSPRTPIHRHHQEHNLCELLSAALGRCAWLAGQRLICEVDQGEIVLRGTVVSYFQKQLAQESVRPLAEGRAIRNEISVVQARAR